MTNWREVLCRVLDGESPSDDEIEVLCAALADEANRAEAAAWLQFEETVAGRRHDATAIAATRDRLLAKAVLREKHAEIVGRRAEAGSAIPPSRSASVSRLSQRRLLRWGPAVLIASSLVIAIMLARPGQRPGDAYAAPLVQGDFHILGPAVDLSRGDRLVSGGAGARLALGGYCDVQLVSHTDVTLQGAPHHEVIVLHQGGLRARVQPGQGAFVVSTPLGPVEARGTDFETTVEYPNGLPGDLSMNSSAKKVIVTVAVLTGAVWSHVGDAPVLLEAGTTRVFAGEAKNNRTSGEVVATTDFSVTLDVESKAMTFQVPKANKLAAHEVGQLLKGDQVTIAWVEEEGRKWVQDVAGEGVVEGTVSALGDAWIEVQVAEGRKLRYRAPWRGGNPADGGGPDRDVVRKLGAVRVGNQVALTWAMPEGKRVMDVAVRTSGQAPAATAVDRGDLTKAPPELYGLSGRVVGRLVRKDVEKGELTLQIVKVDRVWRGNQAKNPRSAEGRTLTIDGVFGKFLDVLLTLDKGEGVQIEVKHVRGDGLTFLGEELKKVEIESGDERPDDTPPADSAANVDAPAGMRGFRGILIGELVSKDVEQGTLVVKMEKVKRVWKADKAPAPEKSVGKPLAVEGIAGKFLDTLLVLEALAPAAMDRRGSAAV